MNGYDDEDYTTDVVILPPDRADRFSKEVNDNRDKLPSHALLRDISGSIEIHSNSDKLGKIFNIETVSLGYNKNYSKIKEIKFVSEINWRLSFRKHEIFPNICNVEWKEKEQQAFFKIQVNHYDIIIHNHHTFRN